MVLYELLLATALLTAEPDLPDPGPEVFAAVSGPLQALALEWEILDPRETKYVLVRPDDFAADLNLLRRRFRDLSLAPPANDALRFPERSVVNELLAFNRAYRQHLDLRLPFESARWEQLREVVQETDHLYLVWDTIRDARCDYYYVTVRRQALQKLRDLLGPEAYYSGRMPPYVPLWRFQAIN